MSKNSTREQKAQWDANWKAKNPERAKQLSRERTARHLAAHRDEILAARKAARVRGTIRPWLSDKEKQVIEQLYSDGFSFKEIGANVQRNGQTVARHLRSKFEIRARPVPSGPKSSGWKGGKHKDQHGYWYVRLVPTDPLISMGGKAGIVYEHRLVMARSLGRPLLPTESVHHVNGDHADNRLENLQLRQGKHGKHIVMTCLDCGSHRLGPVEIAEHEA